MKSKISVSIAIPAYNEADNIGELLKSIIRQRQTNLFIKEIVVVSDASSDQTVTVAKSVSSPQIRVLTGKRRLGKAARLNQLFHFCTGEVIVCLDADVVLADDLVIQMMVKPFLRDMKVMLVGGRPQPLPAHTIIGTGVNNLFMAYQPIREQLRRGHNPYTIWGRIMALRNNFAKTVHLPDIPNDDSYLYFRCLQQGLGYRYQPRAVVWFQSPQTIVDQIHQGRRFLQNFAILSNYFNNEVILDEYKVPLFWQLKIGFYQIVRNPLAYVCIKFLSWYCLMSNMLIKTRENSRWTTISSSKTLLFQNIDHL